MQSVGEKLKQILIAGDDRHACKTQHRGTRASSTQQRRSS
jgi:hypothetical protein